MSDSRAALLHQRGVAASARGDPVRGARLLRDALRRLGWPQRATDPALTGRILISLGHAEAERGHLHIGLRRLDAAQDLVDPQDLGVLDQQRGLMLLRAGRHAEALRWLNKAIPRLAAGSHRDVQARTHLNRATLHLATGEVDAAKADLRLCVRLARSCGLDQLAAKAEHNLGYCEYLSGNIPAALQAYESAAPVLAGDAGLVGVMLVDRARALLAAGLAHDAATDLDGAIAMFARQRLPQDQSDAELVRALAALASGDPVGAAAWAVRARNRFRRRVNTTGAALAALALLQAQFRALPTAARVAVEAQRLAQVLNQHGLNIDAQRASLLAARALVARGATSAAQLILNEATPGRAGPTELHITARLAWAELAVALGQPTIARRHLDAGMKAARGHRVRVGSLDLQAGGDLATVALTDLGHRVVWATGSAPMAFRWSEYSRAQHDRLTPVRPNDDPSLVRALAELRHTQQLAWSAAVAGRPAGAPSPQRLAHLERAVRQRDWAAPGAARSRPVTVPAMVAALDAAGADLMYLLRAGDRLGACVLSARGRRHVLVDLGPLAPVVETARRLHSDLDVLAGQRLPAVMEQAVRKACADNVAQLNDATFGALADHHRADGPIVVVPAGSLAAVPWGCLPAARGRPLTVAPSATAWLADRYRDDSGHPVSAPEETRNDIVLIGGPELDHSDAELDGIARHYTAPTVLRLGDATVEAALRAIDGASVVHIAAHGVHDSENGLFSRIHLADGPLMGYDLQRIQVPPRHVVLASCDLGRSVNRHGDDLLGFAAALVHVGVSTVVAGVARMADAATARAMNTYHDQLVSGRPPAEALAATITAHPLTPLICFGTR